MYELSEFVKPAGNYPPGMSETIYISIKDEITVFPGTISPELVPGDSVRLEGDIEFEVGDGFVKCYATKDTVETMLKQVGQKDGRGWAAEVPFFVPGLNAQFIELLQNDPDLVVLVKRPDCTGTEYLCLGNKCRSMSVEGEFASAKADDESGRFGWNAMFKGYLQSPYFYTGALTIQA